MKVLTKSLHIKKDILIKILTDIIIFLIFYDQIKQNVLSNIQKHSTTQKVITHQTYKKKTNNENIKIQADQAKFYLTDATSYFSGNVIVSYNANTLYADEIYLYKKENYNKKTYILLSGIGNISYNNNFIQITGNKIIADTDMKNIDLYQGNFSFIKQKRIYGSANQLQQRKHNRYTILKNSNFTTCPPHKKYWNIAGSQILYDHKKEYLDLWDVYFKIKKIPILYIPYIQLSVSDKDNKEKNTHIPQYNNAHGIEIKLPYHFNINKYVHGNITTNFIPKQGIQFKNCIQYLHNLHQGSVNLDLLKNEKLNRNYWILYFYNNNCIRKKWHVKNEYVKISDCNYFYNTKSKNTYTNDNYYIKKNMSWKYIDTSWNINFLYKELRSLNQYINNIYNITPQINIDYHPSQFKLLDYHLFSQITYFTNTNYNYPTTTRLHIEPSMNVSSNILHANINTEITLKNTYYQQKNINFYNTINNTNQNIYLKKSVNRFLPLFKSNAKLTLFKKTNIYKKYTQILEPEIQYLYIPYRNQKNIGLYDTTIFETTENTNLFKDMMIYSGLDRISNANHLTSNIITKIYNKNNIESLYISLGQIYFFTPQKIENNTKQPHTYKNNKNNVTWRTNTYWKINQSLGIRSNLQYNTQIKKLKSGNTIIEHHTNNNKIFQINFRYLNSQYFAQIAPEKTDPIYKKNITQIGIIGNYPINSYWTFSGTQFYNTKNKHTINQTIGMQYQTCCWTINAGYERKINLLHNKIINTKKYNNKLLLNLTLSGKTHDSTLQSKTCNILCNSTLPYQTTIL